MKKISMLLYKVYIDKHQSYCILKKKLKTCFITVVDKLYKSSDILERLILIM